VKTLSEGEEAASAANHVFRRPDVSKLNLFIGLQISRILQQQRVRDPAAPKMVQTVFLAALVTSTKELQFPDSINSKSQDASFCNYCLGEILGRPIRAKK
jgi:hypothetical protein